MADGTAGNTGGTTGGNTGGNTAFIAALPETVRGSEHLKDVRDVGDLATRYVGAMTPKAFAEQLPEDIRGEPAFRDIKDLGGLAKGYLGQQKLLGVPREQLLRMPSFDDEKGMGELFNRLGRPESPDKYVLAPPKGRQWSDVDKEFHGAMLPALHAAGMPQKGLERVMEAWNGYATKLVAKIDGEKKAQVTKNEETLRGEWGQAFEQNSTIALGALRHFEGELKLGDALTKDLNEVGLAARPALARFLLHLGTKFMEPGALVGRNGDGQMMKGAAEAKQEMVSLRANKEFMAAYNEKSHVDHKQAVARMEALYKAAHPQAA